jgi:hypothetical protein
MITEDFTFTPEHFHTFVPVLNHLSNDNLSEAEKSDAFLVDKFGDASVELAREWCHQVDKWGDPA